MQRHDENNALPDDRTRIGSLFEEWAAATEEGRNTDAGETMLTILSAVAEHIDANPDAGYARAAEADEAEAAGDWQTARRLYLEELNELKNDVDEGRELRQAKAHLQLAGIDRAEGNLAAGFERAAVAVQIARSADFPYFLAMTLEQFVGFALQVGRTDEALAACDEGLASLRDERLHDLMRAMLLLRRAEVLHATQNAARLRANLDEAWQLLKSESGFAGAGVKARIADWWRLEAKLRSLQGNWPAVREAWERSVSSARHAAELWDGTEWRFNRMLTNLLTEFATAADQAGESQLAQSLLTESRATRRVDQ